MDQVDTLIRGAAIRVTIFVCVRLLIAQRLGRKPLAVASLGVAIACYLLVSSFDLAALVHPDRFALVVGAILAPIALVWAVFEIFYDRPARHWPWFGLAALTAAAGFASAYEPALETVRAVMVGVLYLGVIVIAVLSDPDDLVPERRRFRRAFVVAMAFLGVAITAIELLVNPADVPPVLLPLQAASVLVLSAAFGAWTLQPDNQLWPAPRLAGGVLCRHERGRQQRLPKNQNNISIADSIFELNAEFFAHFFQFLFISKRSYSVFES